MWVRRMRVTVISMAVIVLVSMVLSVMLMRLHHFQRPRFGMAMQR